MDRARILEWLRESDPRRLADLWRRADRVRRRHVGDAVHLRGLVEVSNHCARQCSYCGLRAGRMELTRYRLRLEEVLAAARGIAAAGLGTIVLQAGEDAELSGVWVAAVIRRLKAETELAVTLSLGERTEAELALWREAGADRYLLRFETSNREVFRRLHPPRQSHREVDRVALLRHLRALGYETGTGMLVGLPGTTVEDLAADLQLLADLDPDMVGLGPWIPHPQTPLGQRRAAGAAEAPDQVPATGLMACKVLALARLLCPRANIPSTTAFATLDPDAGRREGLQRGANVVMPNFTPQPWRALYEIYPAKAGGVEADEEAYLRRIREEIEALGRRVGAGRGDSPRYAAVGAAPPPERAP